MLNFLWFIALFLFIWSLSFSFNDYRGKLSNITNWLTGSVGYYGGCFLFGTTIPAALLGEPWEGQYIFSLITVLIYFIITFCAVQYDIEVYKIRNQESKDGD